MPPPPRPSNLVDRARELARIRPSATAFTWLDDGDEPAGDLTFADLDRRARAIAATLEARGLSGARALLLYSPGLEFVCAFLGCLYAGVVAVPLRSPHRADALSTVRGIVRHADGRVVLCDDVTAALRRTDAQPPGENPFDGIEVLRTSALAASSGDGYRPASPPDDALAFVQYTSGSTGAPKGVEVTHANVWANEAMIRAGFSHDDDTVFVGWLPLFHDMGLVGNVLQPLFLGIHGVLMAPTAFVQRPVRWLRAITRFGGTTAGSPNFGYEMCATRVTDDQLEGLDLSSWKVAYNGAEPVRAATLERFRRRFASVGFRAEAFYPCYGLAEASLFVTGGEARARCRTMSVDKVSLSRNRAVHATGAASIELVSSGRAWLDQRVEIVDPETRTPLAAGHVGEVWIQGSNVARGYRNLPPDEPDPFRAVLANGDGPFLRTGDLGFLDGGELFVTGRSKDVLIQNGRNYYPQDIEQCAGASHPHLRPDFAAAFTVDDGDVERLVVAQEVHRSRCSGLERGGPEAEALRHELTRAVKSAISERYGLSAWRVVLMKHATLPRTSSGKVRRRHCRELFERGGLDELVPRTAAPHPLSP